MENSNQNFQTELADVAYDAFISYRHNEMDSAVAKTLQQRLEHFSTSFFNRKDIHPIKRVFMDESELSSSADFELRIRDALKNAKWLIVICSKQVGNSHWVNLEIETFLQYHDREHILAVLVDGEPEEAFPDALLGPGQGSNHILAADARGNSKKEILRKVKGDVLLKIAAPILGTNYDSLKQRRKTYIARRALAAGSVAGVVLLIFTSYILWQSLKIKQEYTLARQNQARYLSKTSLELSKEGNKDDALLTALAIQPDNDEDGSLVPEQMYALNTALDSYTAKGVNAFDVYHTGECSYPVYGQLSDNEKYYYAIDSDHNGYILSTSDGSLVWKITVDDIRSMLDSANSYTNEDFEYGILKILTLSNNKILLCLQRCLIVADIEKQTFLQEYYLGQFDAPINDLTAFYKCYLRYLPEENLQICCTQNQKGENIVAFIDYNSIGYDFETEAEHLYIFNLDTGKIIKKKVFNDKLDANGQGINYTVTSLEWNSKGTQLAIGFDFEYIDSDFEYNDQMFADDNEYNEYTKRSKKYFSTHKAAGLSLYDLDKDDVKTLSHSPVQKVCFTDEDTLACVQSVHQTVNYLDTLGDNTDITCYCSLYDINSGKSIYKGPELTLTTMALRDFPASLGSISTSLVFDGQKENCVILWMGENLYMIAKDTRETLANFSYEAKVIGAARYDDSHLMVMLNNGQAMLVSKDDSHFLTQEQALDLSLTDVKTSVFSADQQEIILQTEKDILICSAATDKNLKKIDFSVAELDDDTLFTCSYVSANDISYRCVAKQLSSGRYVLKIYNTDDNSCVYTYCCNNTNETIELQSLSIGSDEVDTYTVFLISDTGEENEDGDGYTLVKASLTTGKTIIHDKLPSKITDTDYYINWAEYTYNQPLYSKDLSKLFVTYEGMNPKTINNEYGILEADISGDKVVYSDKTVSLTDCYESSVKDKKFNTIYQTNLTGDGKYLAILFSTESSDEVISANICFYNIETGKPDILDKDLSLFNFFKMQTGQDSSKVCVYDTKGNVSVVDAKSKEIKTFSFSSDDNISTAFFNEDTYLFVSLPYYDSIKLLNIESGEILSSYTDLEDLSISATDVLTGKSNQYFALLQDAVDVEADYSLSRSKILIFYIDEDNRLYPYATIQRGRIDLDHLEVMVNTSEDLYYAPLYDYQTLKKTALKYLDGKTLSQEKCKKYFTEE